MALIMMRKTMSTLKSISITSLVIAVPRSLNIGQMKLCITMEGLICMSGGVTHFGTSWNYVLTDIEIERDMSVKM